MRKITVFLVLIMFGWNCVLPPAGFAQTFAASGFMPQPGTMVPPSAAFMPAHLQAVTIDPVDALKFDFLVRKGDEPLTQDQKTEEYTRLIKYFLTALTIPDADQWVNLSPYEGERLISDDFGLTAMGRDLLEQDYVLKQLTASLTHPDTELGRKYWAEMYRRAHDELGSTNVPMDAFNKVWIIPDDAVVYEKGHTAYLLTQRLKVMTERDYLALKQQAQQAADSGAAPDVEAEAVARIASEVMRDIIVPVIEKEVNEGQNFAALRQICSAMILATWYKRALKESILGKVYADQARVAGVDQEECRGEKGASCAPNQKIWEQYVQAFQKGVFNMIKEDVDQYSQEIIPRKYFSGGLERRLRSDGAQVVTEFAMLSPAAQTAAADFAAAAIEGKYDRAATALQEARKAGLLSERQDARQSRVPTYFVLPFVVAALTDLTLPVAFSFVKMDMGAAQRGIAERSRVGLINQEAVSLATGVLERKWSDLKAAFAVSVSAAGITGAIDVEESLKSISEISTEGSINKVLGVVLSDAFKVTMEANERRRVLLSAAEYVLRSLAAYVADKKALVGMQRVFSEDFKMLGTGWEGILPALESSGVLSQELGVDSWGYLPKDFDLKTLAAQFKKQEFLFPFQAKAAGIENVLAGVIARNSDASQVIREDRMGYFIPEIQRESDGEWRFGGGDHSWGQNDYGDLFPSAALRRATLAGDTGVLPLNVGDAGITPSEVIDAAGVPYGGIDLNTSNWSMQIKRDGNGVPLPAAQQNLENLQVDGFIPQILSIQPVTSLSI